jgi:hypothetical protein
VDLFIDLLESTKGSIPQSFHHFYVMPEDTMLEFDKFSDTIKQIQLMDVFGKLMK